VNRAPDRQVRPLRGRLPRDRVLCPRSLHRRRRSRGCRSLHGGRVELKESTKWVQ
jgi:hypothetical protein